MISDFREISIANISDPPIQCGSKGSFNNYVDRILPFFDPPPMRGHFL